MIGWIFRGCALAVLSLFVLFVLIMLGSLGIISVPTKTLAIVFVLIAIVLMAIPICVGLVARMFVKNLAATFEKVAGAAPTSQPAELTLAKLEQGNWNKPAKIKRSEEQLASLGFIDAGEFTIDEMPGLKLHAIAKPSEGVWAVVYDHPQIGVWTDLVTYFSKDESITCVNRADSQLDHRPGHEKIYKADIDVVELYEIMKETRGGRRAVPIKPGDFQEMFERAYRDEMAWRVGRGGPTHEEVQRIAIAGGNEFDGAHLAQAEDRLRTQNRQMLDEMLRKAFLESNQMTPAQWEAVRDRVVFVHEQLTVDEAMDLLGGNAPAGTTTLREAFAAMNESLPEAERYELIGKIESPTPCDVYATRDV